MKIVIDILECTASANNRRRRRARRQSAQEENRREEQPTAHANFHVQQLEEEIHKLKLSNQHGENAAKIAELRQELGELKHAKKHL